MTAPLRIPPALEAAAASLRSRYADRHAPEVVEGTLPPPYRQLSSRAKVQDFVPIFAERHARQRLESGDVALRGSASARPAPRRHATPSGRAAATGSP
jgi:hypothetical protein